MERAAISLDIIRLNLVGKAKRLLCRRLWRRYYDVLSRKAKVNCTRGYLLFHSGFSRSICIFLFGGIGSPKGLLIFLPVESRYILCEGAAKATAHLVRVTHQNIF